MTGKVLRLGMAAALVGSALSTTAVTANAAPAPAPVHWATCDDAALTGVPANIRGEFDCATYRVPVDHAKPANGSVDLALMRHRALAPEKKIGTLFLNNGGPGGSGFLFTRGVYNRFSTDVLQRFDVVGFDPRGVGRSAPLKCFSTREDAEELFSQAKDVPVTKGQVSDTLRVANTYGKFCKSNAGALLQHMSTRDVVQDMELLRQAVRDTKMNFVGFSYGTLIGATYLGMYPKNARAIVIDGNVDPQLRTKDGVEYDRQRAQGFEISLDAVLKRCAEVGDTKCVFAKGGDPTDKFNEMRDYLRYRAISLPNGRSLDINSFTGNVSSALYSVAGINTLAVDLQNAYEAVRANQQGKAKAAVAAAAKSKLTADPARSLVPNADMTPDSPYTADDSYYAVNCSDKPFPASNSYLRKTADQWEAQSPTFGRLQAFSDPAYCPPFPAKKAKPFTGPWKNRASVPALVISNHYDPATQYRFGQRMAQELGNASLVSVGAFGHCILGRSQCVDKITTDYLVNQVTPNSAQDCKPNELPFE